MHGSNVSGLNVVFVIGNSFFNSSDRDLFVFNDTVDLELLDTVTNWDELVTTPDETVHIDGLDIGKEFVHISFIIPWLDIKGDDGLGSWLRLAGSLLLLVFSKSFSLNSFSFFIFFVIGTEEIDIFVIFFFSGSGFRRTELASLSVLITGKRREFFRVRSNVLVPTGSVRVGFGIRSRAYSLVNSNISLGRRDTMRNNPKLLDDY